MTGLGMALAATIRVGVLLPMKDTSSRGTIMIEFYRGLLMAVDAVKTEGTDIEVYAFDCGKTDLQMEELLTKPELSRLDMIFGPLDAGQVTPLSEFCRQHEIRMVLPFNTPCPQVYGNPWIYQVGVAQELLFPNISTLIIENLTNANFVFFHTAENDERGVAFTDHLKQVLSLRGIPTTNLAIGADEFAYDRALNQFRNNVVIPDSRSITALNQMLKELKAYQAQNTQYKVALLGYPEWITYTGTLLRDFYQYDTHLFSAYYRNPLSGRVAKFEQQYAKNYTVPSRNSYPRAEMLGYDLAYFFIHGLATLGKDFDEQMSTLPQQPIQHGFNFTRVGEQGGYINTFVQLVHYSTNHTIQVVK